MRKLIWLALLLGAVTACKKENEEEIALTVTANTTFQQGEMLVLKLGTTTAKEILRSPLNPNGITTLIIPNAQPSDFYKVYLLRKGPDPVDHSVVKWHYSGKEIVQVAKFDTIANRSENYITVQ